jgi:ParB family chromosome partitioning protein
MTPRILEIPLSKLVLSAANVRRTGRENGLEELAASIQAHGLLQSLAVRPELDADGAETGKYRVTGGGRRLTALKLLAKRQALAKSMAVPCIVAAGDEEEASLAENVVRESLHPADQFEAFKRLADEHGASAEEIAARFGVTPQLVRQRLRLGAVSPRLLQVYRDGGLTLDQLTAFALTEDHARQEQAFASLSWNKEPYTIRRLLTEAQVPARDRRAVFVGAEAYVDAGGAITRDLFTEDGGGWFEDAGLVDRLAREKLEKLADDLQAAEGWRWAAVSIDYPHAHGLRRVYPHQQELAPKQQERLDTVQAELEALSVEHDGVAEDSLPEEVRARFDALEAEATALSERTYAYDPQEIARGGVFVMLHHDGSVRIERGFIRSEDELPPEPGPESDPEADATADEPTLPGQEIAAPRDERQGEEEETALRPLSDLLVRDLTAHRTLALRLALGENPDVALLAVIHALVAQTFHRGHDLGTCLDLQATSAPLASHADGIEDSPAAARLAERHGVWAQRVPRDPAELWTFVTGLDHDSRATLFAHCAALTVMAVRLPWDRRPRTEAGVDTLATALDLDLSATWQPTVRSYFGRVPKPRVLEAVREAVGEEAAARLDGMKKQPMAETAEQLVAGTGWLPLVLRTVEASRPGLVEPEGAIDDRQDFATAAE